MPEMKMLSPMTLSSVARPAQARSESEDFKSKIKEVAEMETLGEFIYVLRRIRRLSELKPITDICMFKKGIEPMWEDPYNIAGGKWIIKVRKGVVEQRLFERLMIRCTVAPFQTMEVNGIVVSVRANQTILSIWTKFCPQLGEEAKIDKEIREAFSLKENVPVVFKGNDESLKDKSSFRNLPREVPRA
jgi:translation initiation factor 4E